MGGGPSVGYAVLTHQLGLGGHLARQISAHTGRGCLLDIVANPDMTVQDAPDALRQVHLSDYDAVVTTFGGNEALALMATRTWRNLMNGMLSAIHSSDASPDLHVFMIGVAPISTIVDLPATVVPVVNDRVTRLNEVTARLAFGQTDRSFAPLTAASIRMSDVRGSSAYAEWADQIAPGIASVLLNSGK